MVMLTGFMQGYRDQRDTLNRRRRELAQAFNEFKAQNPTATFDEYQSFIDQYAGDGLGSNYLRGGAPSEDVLRGLSDQNEKVRQAQEQQRMLESVQRRGQMDGQLKGMADEALLNMEGDDFDSAYQSFVERLGGPDAEERFGRETLQGYISPGRLNTLAQEQVRNRLPEIRDYVSMVDAEEIDSKDIADTFGIRNPTILEPLVSRAQEINGRQRQEEAQKNRLAINDALNEAIQNGDPNPVESVKAMFPRVDHEALNGLYQGAQQRAQQAQQEREQQESREIQAIVRDYTNNVFTNENNAVGRGVVAAIKAGRKPEALRLMDQIAKRDLTDQEYQRAFGEGRLETVYDTILTDLQVSQREEYAAYERQASEQSREQALAFTQNNIDAASSLNKGRFNDQVASLAAQLARRYEWSEAAQGAFESAIKNNEIISRIEDGEITPNKAATEIEADATFKQVARPVSERQSEITQAGNAIPFGTMDENTQLVETEITDRVKSGLEKEAERIESAPDLTTKAQELQVYTKTIQQVEADLARKLQMFRQNRDVWLSPGGGGWSADAYSRLQTQAERVIAQARARAAELKVQIEDERAAQLGGQGGSGRSGQTTSSPDANASRSQTTGYSPNQQTGPTPLTEWWKGIVEDMPANTGDPLGRRQDDQ